MTAEEPTFGGAVAIFYERYLVPLIFEPYAGDTASRVPTDARIVLETAAGTGVVTRRLASSSLARIVATDVSQPMLDHARNLGTSREVEWRAADAMQLPFNDRSFDAVVSQFGVMFFADRVRAYAETRRVLQPGGTFIFNVWSRIEDNDFVHVVTNAVATMFPSDPPSFLRRVPHGYWDQGAIAKDLKAGGFSFEPRFEIIAARSRGESAQSVAIAYCQGTPLRGEIEARDPTRLDEATSLAARALAERFGEGPIEAKIQAVVATVRG